MFDISCGGNYLVVVYIFVKLLYLINIAAQLFLLDVFLGTPYHAYGVEVCGLLRQYVVVENDDAKLEPCYTVLWFYTTCMTSRSQQEAQLSQRDRATLRVIEYFAKSLKIIQGYSK